MKNYDDNDLSNKSDEDLKKETYKILEEKVFDEINNVEPVKDYNNYKSENVIQDYNNYSNSYTETKIEFKNTDDSRQKRDMKIIIRVVCIIFVAIILLLFSAAHYIANLYDDMSERLETEMYDIEYDLDSDGYLDYDEMSTYETEQAMDYEKYYTAKELFIDKENNIIYFEIENRNSYEVSYAYINVAFYDENKKLIDVTEDYISNVTVDKKVIEEVRYERDFASYEVVITVDDYMEEMDKNDDANVEIVSTNEDLNYSEIEYALKNNSEDSVSGEIYVIFYDEENNIVSIEQDSVFELASGKTEYGTVYLFKDVAYDHFTIDTSNITIDEY